MFADMFTTSYTAIPSAASTDKLILFGPYKWIFWIGQVVLGFVIPLFLVGSPRTNKDLRWLGLAGLLVIVGLFGARLTLVHSAPDKAPIRHAVGGLQPYSICIRLRPKLQRPAGDPGDLCHRHLDDAGSQESTSPWMLRFTKAHSKEDRLPHET